jgi:holin-like protein
MLEAILALFVCQLLGEVLTRGTGLPIPGPVLGMLLLFLALQLWSFWNRKAHSARAASGHDNQTDSQTHAIDSMPLGKASGFLLAHLSLLFVPAGVGIISHIQVLTVHGVGLIVALVLSTALSLAVTALVFAKVSRWLAARDMQ